MSDSKRITRRDLTILFILLAISLLHGLIYVFIIPPWQHYDEPTHFELAWLTARLGSTPQPNDLDADIRREIAISMREHDFFRDAGFEPPLEENGFIWLGISQLGNRPLYYYLAAIPILIFEGIGITAMLYGARLVSLVFLLLTIWACWGIVTEFTPSGHRLRFYLPLSLALLPGFVDVMTAVNNDSLAAGLAGLLLWLSLRLVRRGSSVINFLAALLLAVLVFGSKETAYPVYVVFLFALLLMFARGRVAFLRPWIWGISMIAGMMGLFWAITSGDAAAWYRITNQEAHTRVANPKAVLGNYVFQFDSYAGYMPDWFRAAIFQPMPALLPDRDQVFTLGAWVWNEQPPESSEPLTARLSIGAGGNYFSREFSTTTEPTFVAITGTVTTNQYKPFRIVLAPGFQSGGEQGSAIVLMDGIVLAQGEFPIDQPPEYNDIQGTNGIWGDQSFQNLARNPSAEQAGLRLRPIMDRITARFLPDQTQGSLILTSITDIQGSRQYYGSAAQWLIATYWGMFGWAHVPLLASPVVGMFAGYTLIAALLTLSWVIKRWFGWRQRQGVFGTTDVLLLAIALVIPWLSAYFRAPMYLGQVNLYLPVARYALAAIIPSIMLINLGFLQFCAALDSKFSTRGWISGTACAGGWVIYALYALASILSFYA